MKKYDLFLLGLFILPVLIGFTIITIYEGTKTREIKAAIVQFEKIYQVPVNTVLIRNTNVRIIVRDANKQLNSQNNIEFSGSMACSYVSEFEISGDTLVIGGEFNPEAADLILWKTDGVKVDTVNAPNIVYPSVQTITTERTVINGIEVVKTDTIIKGGF